MTTLLNDLTDNHRGDQERSVNGNEDIPRGKHCESGCFSGADGQGEYLFQVPGQRSARERRISSHSHQLCLIIEPFPQSLKCLSPLTTATTMNSSLQATLQLQQQTPLHRHHYRDLPHLHRPNPHINICAYNGRPWPQTAPWDRGLCKLSGKPTSVFNVYQNPKISVVEEEIEADQRAVSWKGGFSKAVRKKHVSCFLATEVSL